MCVICCDSILQFLQSPLSFICFNLFLSDCCQVHYQVSVSVTLGRSRAIITSRISLMMKLCKKKKNLFRLRLVWSEGLSLETSSCDTVI